MRWDNVKSIVLKEYWTYVGNRKIIFSTLTVIVLYAIIIGINYITGPKALTSYSRAIAIKQISSSPTVFGIGPLDVKKMGDNAILLAAMVVQLPPTIAVFSYFTTYTSILASFFVERTLGTMEVLFSTPLEDGEILGGKIIASVSMGITTWMALFLTNTLGIEALTLKSLGRMWVPTQDYIILSVLYPLSIVLLAIPIGLLISARAKELGEQVGSLIGIIPVVIVLLLIRMDLVDFFRLIKILTVADFLMILASLKFLKFNRLSFISNP
ncbi:ABC transporter permease subunit [Thermococcus celer]|uniref:Uncharacterized protein n=1 Tax=Thermococcus celer Vu 13 = JCM 8558 TaxID=1293037 RepID=A0A218P0A6_THECE|nr:ABC transporter permease subunit [Thermococcus celer]ASI98329.1 hypothetical protein A3L02_01470 [Thermococcus celer Vu 13 = JCM 8558]